MLSHDYDPRYDSPEARRRAAEWDAVHADDPREVPDSPFYVLALDAMTTDHYQERGLTLVCVPCDSRESAAIVARYLDKQTWYEPAITEKKPDRKTGVVDLRVKPDWELRALTTARRVWPDLWQQWTQVEQPAGAWTPQQVAYMDRKQGVYIGVSHLEGGDWNVTDGWYEAAQPRLTFLRWLRDNGRLDS